MMSKRARKKYIIRGSNGTYFRMRTAIGPCFGGTRETAKRFDTKEDAIDEGFTHSFAFVGSTIETVEDKVS